jgi:hypothetical protein
LSSTLENLLLEVSKIVLKSDWSIKVPYLLRTNTQTNSQFRVWVGGCGCGCEGWWWGWGCRRDTHLSTLSHPLVTHIHIYPVNHWSTLLDPVHANLLRTTHEERIRYLIYDCFARTYFIKPVLEYWTFRRLKETNIVELFTSSAQASSIIKPNRKEITKNINRINRINKINKNIDGQTFKNVLDDDIELYTLHSKLETKRLVMLVDANVCFHVPNRKLRTTQGT